MSKPVFSRNNVHVRSDFTTFEPETYKSVEAYLLIFTKSRKI